MVRFNIYLYYVLQLETGSDKDELRREENQADTAL